jgi:hypothetical protein
MSSPVEPSDPKSSVEHSTWVEDWSANLDTDQYINSLCDGGVNTINIFVGQLDIVDGKPTIDGYSMDTPGLPGGTGMFPSKKALTDFITRCKEKGINVKLSIGGADGNPFGESWKKLTDSNIDDFAKALVDICKQTGAEGIDFDDELEDTTIAARAGKLAAAFKAQDPDLQASFCVFGGISDSGPMHAVDKVFLENAKLKDGQSVIDRVYVMTYYDGCTVSENEQFMKGWATWLKSNFQFSPSQISIGVDPNDPNTLPTTGLKSWIEFAKENGFSTAIWDNQGSYDYIKNDWGDIVKNLYDKN